MAKKLFVGNLSYSTNDDELREAFAAHGEVISAKVINDRDTGRSRGFGFVEMDDADAGAAAEAINGTELGGRTLRVEEANEKRPRRRDDRW